MDGGEEFVAVAQVVLAELGRGVAYGLEDLRNRRIALLDAPGGTGNADGGHAGADGQLPHDKGGATGGAAWLAIVVGEDDAFFGDSVDVGGVTHHPVGVSADVPHADVVAKDDDDLRLLRALGEAVWCNEKQGGCERG